MLRCLSLFSGIGGIDLAATVSGFEIAALCEIDPFCRSVLQTHWPDVPIYPDVKEVSYDRLERDGLLPIDCLYGGPPCQDASLAGKRRGQRGERWLWPEFLRVVGEVRPRWCVAENPVGILSIDAKRAWGALLGTLGEMGYRCGWGVWGAGDVGAPHRRERVFLVGCRGDAELADTHSDRRGEWKNQSKPGSGRDAATDPRLDGAQGVLADAGGSQWGTQAEERQDVTHWSHARGQKTAGRSGLRDQDLADSPGQGLPHRFADGFSPRTAASGAGMESQPERCGPLADTAGRQCQWRTQPETGRDKVSERGDVWPDAGGCRDAVADAARGEDRWQSKRGLPSDTPSSGRAVADPESEQREWSGSARGRQSRSANDGDALADAPGARLEERAGIRGDLELPYPSAPRASDPGRGNDAGGAKVPQCGVGGMLDGIPPGVDHPCWPAGPGEVQAAWEPPRTIGRGVDPYRRKRLHALGNAVVPAQIAPLFRAIAVAEREWLGSMQSPDLP